MNFLFYRRVCIRATKAWRVQGAGGGSKPRPTSPPTPPPPHPPGPEGAQSCWLSRPLIYTPLTLLPRPRAPSHCSSWGTQGHRRLISPCIFVGFFFFLSFLVFVILVFHCPLKRLAPMFRARTHAYIQFQRGASLGFAFGRGPCASRFVTLKLAPKSSIAKRFSQSSAKLVSQRLRTRVEINYQLLKTTLGTWQILTGLIRCCYFIVRGCCCFFSGGFFFSDKQE